MWFPSFLWLMAEGAPFNLFRSLVKRGSVNEGWVKGSAQILCILKHPFYAIMAHREPSLFGSRLQGIPTEVGFENRVEHLSLLLIDYGFSVPNLISKWYRLHLLHPLFEPQPAMEVKLDLRSTQHRDMIDMRLEELRLKFSEHLSLPCKPQKVL